MSFGHCYTTVMLQSSKCCYVHIFHGYGWCTRDCSWKRTGERRGGKRGIFSRKELENTYISDRYKRTLALLIYTTPPWISEEIAIAMMNVVGVN